MGRTAPNKPTILLISFKFPPYEGVGGNRWMNLTQQLASLGCQIHVVTVNWKKAEASPWADYLPPRGVQIHRIRSGFTHNLFHSRPRNQVLNLLRKVLFSRQLLRRIWWDDEAQYWGRHLLPYCTRLARQVQFDVLIATGHPFEANYLAARLSRKLDLPLIQDLRDPWIDNPYVSYSRRQKQLLLTRVRTALQDCEKVVAVTQGLLNVYCQHADLAEKGAVIQNGHGIDTPEVREPTPRSLLARAPDFRRFVYLGNISNGREEPFEWLMTSIEKRRQTCANGACVAVFSVQREILEKKYERYVHTGALVFRTPVAQNEIPTVLAAHDAAIHLTARAFPYLASTKIYEYAAARIPTISVNYGGGAELLIKDLDCGVSINLLEDHDEHTLEDAIRSLSQPFTYRVENFHWKALAKQYLGLIGDVLSKRSSKA